jgi:hypothetical protein
MSEKKKSLKERSIAVEMHNGLIMKDAYDFNYMKAIEELNELSLALVQYKTKKRTSNPLPVQEVIDEIGDAKRKIWYLERIFGVNNVKRRIESKVSKLEKKKGIKNGT